MQYFKPAAGLIVLIFILLIIFVFFMDFMKERDQQASQAKADSQQDSYNQCISTAESNRNWGKSISDDLVLAMKESGNFNTAMDECMRVKYIVPENSVLAQEMKDSLWLQAENLCTQEVTQGIKATGFPEPYDDVSLAERYEDEIAACQTKYEMAR